MTAMALVTGTLFRPPEQRTSKAGKPFVAATIRVKDGDPSTGSGQASQWWKVLAFSEGVQAELLSLQDGDTILKWLSCGIPRRRLCTRRRRPCIQ
jgi:hypothetical protein